MRRARELGVDDAGAEVKAGGGFGAGRVGLAASGLLASGWLPLGRAEIEAGVGVLADSAPAATSAESLPAKSGSIMAWASRMSWRKDSMAMRARGERSRFAMAEERAFQVDWPVSRASRSRVSRVVLPMPRTGC